MGNPQETQNLQELGPYRLTNLLGFNGVVATFKGFDQTTNLPAAVVVIDSDDVKDKGAWERFRGIFEPMISGGASRIAQPAMCGEDFDHYWASYQWMVGSHLGLIVRDHGLPAVPQAFTWMAEVCEGLDKLHKSGTCHRILSPASIFINDFHQAKVLHAGWSELLTSCRPGLISPEFASVLPFMSPEMAASKPADPASDVYSIGANLFFLLSGQPVFWHDDPRVLADMLANQDADLSVLPDEVPADARELLDELLSRDPEDRPVNLPALSQRLAALGNAVDQHDHEAISRTREERLPEVGVDEETLRARIPTSAEYPTDLPLSPHPQTESEEEKRARQSKEEYERLYGGGAQEPEPHATPSGTHQGYEESDQFQQRNPSIRDIVEERRRMVSSGVHSVEDVAVPPPQPEPKKKRITRTMLMIAGALIVLIGAGAWAFMFFTGALDPEVPSGPNKFERKRVAGQTPESLYNAYRDTRNQLRILAQWNRAYLREYGLYPQKPEDLTQVGAQKNEFMDAWGRDVDIRDNYVLSPGADGEWDNDDDLWWDTETNIPGGYMPPDPAAGGVEEEPEEAPAEE